MSPSLLIACGLHLPDEAIVDPFSRVYAYCLDAVENGVAFRRSWRVEGLERYDAGWTLSSGEERITASFLINAGGIRADLVDRLALPSASAGCSSLQVIIGFA